MRKSVKIYRVRNLKTGEEFLTRTDYVREIDGADFIGVWRETDPQKRVNYMRKDSLTRVTA